MEAGTSQLQRSLRLTGNGAASGETSPGPSPALSGTPLLTAPLRLIVLAAALLRGGFWLLTQATAEDAFISLRYAENLAAGMGMVYNPGEAVFGATTPLYVLLLGGLTWVGLPSLACARLLAIAADAWTIARGWKLVHRATGSRQAAGLTGWLLAAATPMVQVGVSGMETSFFVLLLTWAADLCCRERPSAVRLGLVLGVLCLVRPDGLVAATLLLGTRAAGDRRMPLVAGLTLLLVLSPWIAWATVTYGSPLPNSIAAKAAAYNAHRVSPLPGFLVLFSFIGPLGVLLPRFVVTLFTFPCLLAGIRMTWRAPGLRALPVLFLGWFAFLVLPRTLPFHWYLPPLLLPAYLLAGVGLPGLLASLEARRRGPSTRAVTALATLLLLSLAAWLFVVGKGARRIQQAEERVRRPLGLWLRERVRPGERVALEPIGYIGYYSRARILDEIGLVSPEMIPLNRAGAGWFAEMLARYRPEYVVERPHYLQRNSTINTKVPMFRDDVQRRAFLHDYEPLATFATTDLPRTIVMDYHFVVYRRRGGVPAPGRE